MEADEIHEFQENLEEGKAKGLFEVSFSISVLAVLVALTTVLGHRMHTEAILQQNRATDQWGLYQAKRIRQSNITLGIDELTLLAPSNPAAVKKVEQYKAHIEKWDDDLKESQDKAHELEVEVLNAEHKASRFDLGEALLQIAVVLCSVTLLTSQRIFWVLGLGFGAIGLGVALTSFFVR